MPAFTAFTIFPLKSMGNMKAKIKIEAKVIPVYFRSFFIRIGGVLQMEKYYVFYWDAITV
jgi:hypothetical protein